MTIITRQQLKADLIDAIIEGDNNAAEALIAQGVSWTATVELPYLHRKAAPYLQPYPNWLYVAYTLKTMRLSSLAALCSELPLIQQALTTSSLQDDKNEALIFAAYRGDLDVVQYLIGIGADPSHNASKVLELPSSCGHAPMIDYLLSTGAKARDNRSDALYTAALYGYLDIAKTLIKAGAKISDLDTDQLSDNNHPEIIAYFMTETSFYEGNYNQRIQTLCCSENKDIRREALAALKRLGFPPIQLKRDGTCVFSSLRMSLNKGPSPFKTPQSLVLFSATLSRKIKKKEAKLASLTTGLERQSTESAMNTALVKSAMQHFDYIKSDDTLKAQLKTQGYWDEETDEIDIIKTERVIKNFLLSEIITTLSHPAHAQAISENLAVLHFLEQPHHIEQLIANDKPITDAFRALLETDALRNLNPIIAWRVYDAGSPVDADWPNLFITADAVENSPVIYTTRETSSGPLTQHSGSKVIRTLGCYCFILATGLLSGAVNIERVTTFTNYLAEGQQAHSEPGGIDSPSCFPGWITRLFNTLRGTAYALPVNITSFVKDQMANHIAVMTEKAFECIDKNPRLNLAEKKKRCIVLFHALTGLHREYQHAPLIDAKMDEIFKQGFNAEENTPGFSDPSLLLIRKSVIGGKAVNRIPFFGTRNRFYKSGSTKKERCDYYVDAILQRAIEEKIVIHSDTLPLIRDLIDLALIDFSHHTAFASIQQIFTRMIEKYTTMEVPATTNTPSMSSKAALPHSFGSEDWAEFLAQNKNLLERKIMTETRVMRDFIKNNLCNAVYQQLSAQLPLLHLNPLAYGSELKVVTLAYTASIMEGLMSADTPLSLNLLPTIKSEISHQLPLFIQRALLEENLIEYTSNEEKNSTTHLLTLLHSAYSEAPEETATAISDAEEDAPMALNVEIRPRALHPLFGTKRSVSPNTLMPPESADNEEPVTYESTVKRPRSQ